MKIDYSGAELFLEYSGGRISLQHVIEHPAYQAVKRHAQAYSNGLTAQDIADAVSGKPSPFYGLRSLRENLPRIQALLAGIHQQEETWITAIESTLAELFPGEALDITVYPIIGYDMGIGLDGVVCMNCNHAAYLEEPFEFLFYIIHECVHVIYERCHTVQSLAEVSSPEDWRAYFHMWVQNEGFAVYAPLKLRAEMGYLFDPDYRVLFDPQALEVHRRMFLLALKKLEQDQPLPLDEILEICFGSNRLTYRLGCEMIRRVEQTFGITVVQEAFGLDGDTFFQKYRYLLDI